MSVILNEINYFWKLGFNEVKTDLFIKKYEVDLISIDTKNELIIFGTTNNVLNFSQKNFIILETVNRLLDIGYYLTDIEIKVANYINIAIHENYAKIGVICAEYEEEYEQFLNTFTKNIFEEFEIVYLYSSRLKAGLIEYKGKLLFYNNKNVIEISNFISKTISKKIEYQNKEKDFIISDDGVLIEYKGNNEIITIPKGVVKLKNALFWNNTTIKKVVLPDTLQHLGGDTFYNCINIEYINIPSNVKYIGDNPFANCPKLKLVCNSLSFVYENGVLYDSLKKRIIYVDIKLSIKKLVMPSSVIAIGKHAFYNCQNIKTVFIGKNVRIIENNPFSNLPKLNIVNKSKHFVFKNGALYNKAMTTLFYYEHSYSKEELNIPEGVRIIGRHSFYNCQTIKKITIPSSVEIIGYNPFARCSNLKIFNKSPNYIYDDCTLYNKDKTEIIFHSACSNKKQINIPNGVTKIGRSAFFDCKTIEKVVLPKTLKSIERSAFANCENLQEINLNDNIKIDNWVFLNCQKLGKR